MGVSRDVGISPGPAAPICEARGTIIRSCHRGSMRPGASRQGSLDSRAWLRRYSGREARKGGGSGPPGLKHRGEVLASVPARSNRKEIEPKKRDRSSWSVSGRETGACARRHLEAAGAACHADRGASASGGRARAARVTTKSSSRSQTEAQPEGVEPFSARSVTIGLCSCTAAAAENVSPGTCGRVPGTRTVQSWLEPGLDIFGRASMPARSARVRSSAWPCSQRRANGGGV